MPTALPILFLIVALQWHYEKTVDVEKICAELQEDNKKKKNFKWDTDARQVGFIR